MEKITEEQAKEILDFIAKKLGYEAMAISFARVLYVFTGSNIRLTLLRTTKCGAIGIVAHNFKQALMKVLGTTCMTLDSCIMSKNTAFTVPGSLEELLMMIDLEA